MKRVFITGGNGSIGKSIVNIFRSKNYEVVSPSSKELDLKDNSQIKAYFEDIKECNFDVFIHCAGINNPQLIENLEINNLLDTIQINSISFANIMKYIIPYQKKVGGYILGISSIYGIISRSGRAPYSMSKHAMLGLIQAAAIELGIYNIKVNCLSPGFVNTSLTFKNNSEDKIKSLITQIPLKQLSEPEYIAEVAYFLCSENNKYITGENIVADGGFICGGFQNE